MPGFSHFQRWSISEITIDTIDEHYWNYKIDPQKMDASWGESVYTDLVDIGMLKLCGKGVAMGNALEEVKSIADVVIGSNDEDGIAEYLAEKYL